MIQPLAFIHSDAKIANNVVIDPFTTINKNVEIGEGTWIGSNVTIMEGAKIGKNCRIFPGSVIAAIPQDLKFEGEKTRVIIGDNVTIRECVTINRGTKDKYKTQIGNNCLLMAYSHIAHDCIVENNCIIANGTQLGGHVEIGEYAIIGGNSGIHQFVSIGKHAFISGLSFVSKDIPPYAKAARSPVSYVGINSIGLRRRGFSTEQINHIQDIYRILFIKGYNTTQALKIIEAKIPATEERDEVISFIKNAKRGIMKGYYQHRNE